MWFHNSIIGERFTKYLTNFRKKWKINHEFPFFYNILNRTKEKPSTSNHTKLQSPIKTRTEPCFLSEGRCASWVSGLPDHKGLFHRSNRKTTREKNRMFQRLRLYPWNEVWSQRFIVSRNHSCQLRRLLCSVLRVARLENRKSDWIVDSVIVISDTRSSRQCKG